MARRSGITMTDNNNIPRVLSELSDGWKIQVGIFDDGSEQAMIAYVHEFGTTIKPKKAKWLTIPLIPEAKGKSAGEFSDLTFYKSEDGETAFLGRPKRNSEEMENVFMLVKSITIPERSFIRAGWDANEEEIFTKLKDLLSQVINNGVSMRQVVEMIGLEARGKIQQFARDLNDPANSSITLDVKAPKKNPLVDTGDMIGAITYEVSR